MSIANVNNFTKTFAVAKRTLGTLNQNIFYNYLSTSLSLSIPLDLTIVLGPCKFSLQATADHQGNSMHCSHHTTSISYWGKTLYWNEYRITECNISNTRNFSTVYTLLYKLIMGSIWPGSGGCNFINSHGAHYFPLQMILLWNYFYTKYFALSYSIDVVSTLPC